MALFVDVTLVKKHAKGQSIELWVAAVCIRELWCYLVFMNIPSEHRCWRAVAISGVMYTIYAIRIHPLSIFASLIFVQKMSSNLKVSNQLAN